MQRRNWRRTSQRTWLDCERRGEACFHVRLMDLRTFQQARWPWSQRQSFSSTLVGCHVSCKLGQFPRISTSICCTIARILQTQLAHIHKRWGAATAPCPTSFELAHSACDLQTNTRCHSKPHTRTHARTHAHTQPHTQPPLPPPPPPPPLDLPVDVAFSGNSGTSSAMWVAIMDRSGLHQTNCVKQGLVLFAPAQKQSKNMYKPPAVDDVRTQFKIADVVIKRKSSKNLPPTRRQRPIGVSVWTPALYMWN